MDNECVLYDRACTDCGECDVCDLDENKTCNNCGKCLDEAEEFRTLNLEEFMQVEDDEEKVNKKRKS